MFHTISNVVLHTCFWCKSQQRYDWISTEILGIIYLQNWTSNTASCNCFPVERNELTHIYRWGLLKNKRGNISIADIHTTQCVDQQSNTEHMRQVNIKLEGKLYKLYCLFREKSTLVEKGWHMIYCKHLTSMFTVLLLTPLASFVWWWYGIGYSINKVMN